MRSWRAFHIPSLAILLILVLTAQVGVQNFVWCLGEDGHSALEMAKSKLCAAGVLSQQDEDCHGDDFVGSLDGDEHCGPCLDIAASVDATSSRTKYRKLFEAHLQPEIPPSSVPISTAVAPSIPVGCCSSAPTRTSQSIRMHRTVVLLT